MSVPAAVWPVLLFNAALIVCFRVYLLIRKLWSYPLKHGHGCFFGIEVAPGFYEGPAVGWLRRFRALVAAEHTLEVIVLVAILASGDWKYLPVWAGGGVVLLLSTLLGFHLYVRCTLGVSFPAPSSVAVTLESRRLGDYLTWPAEVVCWTLAAASWGLLVFSRRQEISWSAPVMLTYVALGLLSLKITWIRAGIPLPAERTEEHHRWLDASRRYLVRTCTTTQWFLIAILGVFAVMGVWPDAHSAHWFLAGMIVILAAAGLVMTLEFRRLSVWVQQMGRDLRSFPSCWPRPFGGTRLTSIKILTVLFLLGQAALLFYFWHRR